MFLKTLLFLILALAIVPGPAALAAEPIRYFGQTEGGYQSALPYGDNPGAGRYADAGDARIYYEVYGEGEPVVVLHGGLVGSMAEMGEFIDRLAPKHQVIVVSTRGHGKSEAGRAVPSYERKAEDLKAVLAQVTRTPVSIIGFSDGAYTGYYFAAAYPDKVKRLVAIGAGEWKQGFRQFSASSQEFSKMDAPYWQQQMQLRPAPRETEAWYQATIAYYRQMAIGRELFSRIRVPVLVLAGEKDANAPLETVLAAHRMINGAQLAIIAAAPHPVFLVNFPAVWANIEPFLAKER